MAETNSVQLKHDAIIAEDNINESRFYSHEEAEKIIAN
jgi:hypothetical protein